MRKKENGTGSSSQIPDEAMSSMKNPAVAWSHAAANRRLAPRATNRGVLSICRGYRCERTAVARCCRATPTACSKKNTGVRQILVRGMEDTLPEAWRRPDCRKETSRATREAFTVPRWM